MYEYVYAWVIREDAISHDCRGSGETARYALLLHVAMSPRLFKDEMSVSRVDKMNRSCARGVVMIVPRFTLHYRCIGLLYYTF